MARLTISESELMAALAERIPSAPKDARTAVEIAADTGMAHSQVMKALRKLHHAGRIVTHRVPKVGIDGRHVTVPAYTIRPEP